VVLDAGEQLSSFSSVALSRGQQLAWTHLRAAGLRLEGRIGRVVRAPGPSLPSHRHSSPHPHFLAGEWLEEPEPCRSRNSVSAVPGTRSSTTCHCHHPQKRSRLPYSRKVDDLRDGGFHTLISRNLAGDATQVVYASEPGVAPQRAATMLDGYLQALERTLGPDCVPPRGAVHVHFCTLLSAQISPSEVCAPLLTHAACCCGGIRIQSAFDPHEPKQQPHRPHFATRVESLHKYLRFARSLTPSLCANAASSRYRGPNCTNNPASASDTAVIDRKSQAAENRRFVRYVQIRACVRL
jgi:hypothetical protein